MSFLSDFTVLSVMWSREEDSFNRHASPIMSDQFAKATGCEVISLTFGMGTCSMTLLRDGVETDEWGAATGENGDLLPDVESLYHNLEDALVNFSDCIHYSDPFCAEYKGKYER